LIIAGPVLMSLAGVIAALVIGEFAVRLFEGESLLPLIPPEPYIDNAILYRKNPTRFYELRPGVDAVVSRARIHIHINAQGQRDDLDRPLLKPAGVYRVVVLGDSFTFGGKTPLEQTFGRDLERNLRSLDGPRDYEVINLAVPGYNTEQEMLSLREQGLAYHPDLVVVNFVLNDANRMAQLVPKDPHLPLSLRRVLKRSDLVQFVYARVKQISEILHGGAFLERDKYSDIAAGDPHWEVCRHALAEIQRLASIGRAELLVTVWPMLVDLGPSYPHRAQHQLVVAECRRLGIPVLDLLPIFEGHEASRLWATRDDHHPNAAALAMAAGAVVRDLAARHVLPAAVVRR
jgi:GDSL-like Lipase/Acylhydrolase family